MLLNINAGRNMTWGEEASDICGLTLPFRNKAIAENEFLVYTCSPFPPKTYLRNIMLGVFGKFRRYGIIYLFHAKHLFLLLTYSTTIKSLFIHYPPYPRQVSWAWRLPGWRQTRFPSSHSFNYISYICKESRMGQIVPSLNSYVGVLTPNT